MIARTWRKRGQSGTLFVEGLGRDALAIINALSIEKVHWLGLSMGSIVGLWLLIHARERIGRAVLANTAAQIPGPDLWNSRIQSARQTGMDGVAAAAAERWFTRLFATPNPEKVEARLGDGPDHAAKRLFAACAAGRDMDQREAIRSIGNKVLVIAGRHDLSTPPGWAPWLRIPSKAPNSSRWKHRIFRISRMRQISPRPPSLF